MLPTMTFKLRNPAEDCDALVTGTATFIAGGLTHSIKTNEADAKLLHRLMVVAHEAALAAGQRALAQLVTGTVEPYRAR